MSELKVQQSAGIEVMKMAMERETATKITVVHNGNCYLGKIVNK